MNLSSLRANWRTSLSGIGAALFAALTAVAALPYQLGDVATILPPEWKPVIFKWSLIATVVLKILNSAMMKDAAVAGNGTVNDPNRVADPATGRSVIVPSILFAILIPIGGGLALSVAALLFTGCVTDREGHTRFDVDTTQRVIGGAWDVYDRYQRTPAAAGIRFRTDPAPPPKPPPDGDDGSDDEEILIDPPGAPFPLIVTRVQGEP